MKLSLSLTLLLSAMGVDQTTADGTYTLFNGTDTGACFDSAGVSYSTALRNPDKGADDMCAAWPGHAKALQACDTWCRQHTDNHHIGLQVAHQTLVNCWSCQCLFDDPSMTGPPGLGYSPQDSYNSFVNRPGTGPIARTEIGSELGLSVTCYKWSEYTTRAPTPTKAPIITSSPTKAPVTSSPTKAPVTASPTKAGTYDPVNGTDTGYCKDSNGVSYSIAIGPTQVKDVGNGLTTCVGWPGHTTALNYCDSWCREHTTNYHIGLEIVRNTGLNCWGCACIFDDPSMTGPPGDYIPPHIAFEQQPGTGPIASTIPSPDFDILVTCYKWSEYTSRAPTAAPIITSSPTKAPVTSSPAKAPVTASPTKAQNTLSPTRKPTTAGKSSKGTKTTKGPSAKSAKGVKRV